jgi:hypothetical protein
MKIQTMKQALAEARRRWGSNAAVQMDKRLALPYSVGLVWVGMAMEVKGQGRTWDEAFAKCDEETKRRLEADEKRRAAR